MKKMFYKSRAIMLGCFMAIFFFAASIEASAQGKEETDYDKLKKEVKEQVLQALKKTQFESEKDYLTRLRSFGKKELQEVTNKVVKERKKNLRGKYEYTMDYDAENEAFDVEITELHHHIKVPVSKAYAEKFSKALYRNPVAYVTRVIMVDNQWTAGAAVMLFNTYSMEANVEKAGIGIQWDDLYRTARAQESILRYVELESINLQAKTCVIGGMAYDFARAWYNLPSRKLTETLFDIRTLKLTPDGNVAGHVYFFSYKNAQPEQDLNITLQELGIDLDDYDPEKIQQKKEAEAKRIKEDEEAEAKRKKEAEEAEAKRIKEDEEANRQLGLPPHAASTQTWTFGDSELVWSDAIHIPDCNKTSFTGNTPDCRSYTYQGKTYYYYKWSYVNTYSTTLCPSPWHVPFHSDFVTLAQSSDAATLISAWGYSGVADGRNMKWLDSIALYWSATEMNKRDAFVLTLYQGETKPNLTREKYYGLPVRCVK
jgi:uncharacterized protein (TIGR02145 family)